MFTRPVEIHGQDGFVPGRETGVSLHARLIDSIFGHPWQEENPQAVDESFVHQEVDEGDDD